MKELKRREEKTVAFIKIDKRKYYYQNKKNQDCLSI